MNPRAATNLFSQSGLQLVSDIPPIKTASDLYFPMEFHEFLTKYLNNVKYDSENAYVYNNMNFAICQAIVECRTGKSYEDYVREVVLEPMIIDTTTMVPSRCITQVPRSRVSGSNHRQWVVAS